MNPFIVKVASRCNLNCSYCYVYNKADHSWRSRPARMSMGTFEATIERIRLHCVASGQSLVAIVFHGGEPTLIGAPRFAAMCAHARDRLAGVAEVVLTIQSNGTLFDAAWATLLTEHDVYVGVSLDGPREVNDRARVDHRGRSSYDSVMRGIAALQDGGVPFAILSVIQPGSDPLATHRQFVELGCKALAYMFPSYTHDTIGPVIAEYGPTPCADFLIPIFDEWWINGTPDVSIREFWSMGRVIMGGRSQLDGFGNPPLRYVAIETDGSIHGIDSLRICEDEMTATALNVFEADFREVVREGTLHAAIAAGMPLPTGCQSCVERLTCGGGFVPHRYSQARGFDNPSVWCADLLKLFAHVRARMGVDHADTLRRRLALSDDSAAQPHRLDPFSIAAL